MKVTILTPTFNDEISIKETIKSIANQTFTDWQWVVVNDGSTDNTEEVINKTIIEFGIESKCKYIYQENSDQLNAIIHGLSYVEGEYIFILHSDDLLPSNLFLEKCISVMEQSPEIDGIFGDLEIINERGETIGVQKVNQYSNDEEKRALMLLWLGRNLYSDVAFHKTQVYKDQVHQNYLNWNIPLWIDANADKIRSLNYKNIDWPILKYRVHENNYINNKIGKMNVINGELRTAVLLMRYYNIKFFRLQYFLFRVLNKLNIEYSPWYSKNETKNKYKIIKFIVDKRYPNGLDDNIFIESILKFYEIDSDRELFIDATTIPQTIYYGKDIRLFNNRLINNSLEQFYYWFMDEMKKGFGSIIVADEYVEEKLSVILKFFCIYNIKIRRQ